MYRPTFKCPHCDKNLGVQVYQNPGFDYGAVGACGCPESQRAQIIEEQRKDALRKKAKK